MTPSSGAPSSSRAIAKKLGVSKSTILRDLAAAGYEPHWSDRVSGRDGKSYPASRATAEETIRRALFALEQGLSVDEVVAALNVSPRSVRRWRLEYHLEERPGGPNGPGGRKAHG